MESDRAHSDPKIEVSAAPSDQKSVLANLLELYQYDFSEFMELEIGVDGRYGYRDLDLYWTDPQRFPFLIFAGGKLAGFVLVRRMTQETVDTPNWDMAEFFVLRGFRRSSVGTRSAMEVFARFQGHWQVRVMRSNLPACAFWSRAVRLFAGDSVRLHHHTDHGREWIVFSFHSPPSV
jgi:predicted acetyltransferase